MSDIFYLITASDDRIAYRHTEGRGPTILFLPGYASDMEGSKATALEAWAERSGRAMLRFDYLGCGMSDGLFEEQSLAGWRYNVLALIDDVAEGPVVLAGSSMGGWLMLLAALERPERVAGLVGIAPAPDFTSWGFTQDQKLSILRDGRIEQPSPYGEPTVTTRTFWESAETLRLLHHEEIAIACPVRLLHGQRDAEVPWAWSLELMKKLRSADVQANFIKDGDHRLSRDQDIALLIATVETLLETL